MLDLSAVTEAILDRMQMAGWFLEACRERRFDRPTAWDINCGWCREWAELAVALHGGAIVWLDEFGYDPDEISHAVMELDGKLYDAQHPSGVSSAANLDVVLGVSRTTFLEITNTQAVAA